MVVLSLVPSQLDNHTNGVQIMNQHFFFQIHLEILKNILLGRCSMNELILLSE
jgi:hypothetical protein